MRDLDALRMARRSGRVDHVHEIVGRGLRQLGRAGRRVVSCDRATGELEPAELTRGDVAEVDVGAALCHHHRGPDILDDPAQRLGRVVRRKRHAGRARAQHPEHRDGVVERPDQMHPHDVLRSHAAGHEPSGDRDRSGAQVSEGQRPRLEDERDGAGRAPRLPIEELDDRVAEVERTIVARPRTEQQIALGAREQFQPAHAPLGMRQAVGEQHPQMLAEPPDRRPVKQRRVVLERHGDRRVVLGDDARQLDRHLAPVAGGGAEHDPQRGAGVGGEPLAHVAAELREARVPAQVAAHREAEPDGVVVGQHDHISTPV